jgi:hypothetical protein
LNEAISGFDEELASFNVETLGHAAIQEAGSLLKKYGKIYGLRTLDALHLSAFSLISEKDWIFVSADKNLCDIVQVFGFTAINPVKI